MKNVKWLGLFGAVILVAVGCNRSDNSSTSSSSSSNAATLTPASRDRTPSRVYSDTSETNAPNAREPNNTGKNVRDRSDSTLTPMDQGGSQSDLEITRKIRAAVTGNDQFSADAKNVKIITQNGKVTLRGPVANDQERAAIVSLVEKAGVTTVDNQLEIKATNR